MKNLKREENFSEYSSKFFEEKKCECCYKYFKEIAIVEVDDGEFANICEKCWNPIQKVLNKY